MDNLFRLDLVGDVALVVALVVDPPLDVPRARKVPRAAGDEDQVDDAAKDRKFCRRR